VPPFFDYADIMSTVIEVIYDGQLENTLARVIRNRRLLLQTGTSDSNSAAIYDEPSIVCDKSELKS